MCRLLRLIPAEHDVRVQRLQISPSQVELADRTGEGCAGGRESAQLAAASRPSKRGVKSMVFMVSPFQFKLNAVISARFRAVSSG